MAFQESPIGVAHQPLFGMHGQLPGNEEVREACTHTHTHTQTTTNTQLRGHYQAKAIGPPFIHKIEFTSGDLHYQ